MFCYIILSEKLPLVKVFFICSFSLETVLSAFDSGELVDSPQKVVVIFFPFGVCCFQNMVLLI